MRRVAEVRDWMDTTRCDCCQALIQPIPGRRVVYSVNEYGKKLCVDCDESLTQLEPQAKTP